MVNVRAILVRVIKCYGFLEEVFYLKVRKSLCHQTASQMKAQKKNQPAKSTITISIK